MKTLALCTWYLMSPKMDAARCRGIALGIVAHVGRGGPAALHGHGRLPAAGRAWGGFKDAAGVGGAYGAGALALHAGPLSGRLRLALNGRHHARGNAQRLACEALRQAAGGRPVSTMFVAGKLRDPVRTPAQQAEIMQDHRLGGVVNQESTNRHR